MERPSLLNHLFRFVLTVAILPTAGGLAEDTTPAPSESSVVPDFALLDHEGKHHRLYYYQNDPQTRAVVLFVQGNGCPLVRKRIPQLKRMRDEYRDQGVVFWMINANPQDLKEDVVAEAREFDIDIPILLDETQLVAGSLDITRTGETIVIEPDTWQIRYRGAIDDRLDYQAQKPVARHAYLRQALDAVIQGKPVAKSVTRAPGCAVSFEDTAEPISYAQSIAPLLKSRCVDCHTAGGIGPFAMSSYKRVRGWAEMIREVVVTRQMPPWQADPHFGKFSHDLSLQPKEARLLVQWIDAGAPRGEGEDPLVDYRPQLPEWKHGPPDIIVEIPEQAIPAEGILDYRYVTIDAPTDEDVWLSAVEVNPGNTRVLHHIIATMIETKDGDEKKRKPLAGYAPGAEPNIFPEGTGRLLKAGTQIKFQLHYTASGKEETDRSRLGLYVSKTIPQEEYRAGVLINAKFKIPPGDREFVARKSRKIDQDVLLYSMNPHMHLRGKWMRYSVRYPDGTEEILLNVPKYHFDWQRNYVLETPKRLPKGSELIVEAAWDNSTLNPYNPDPEKEVTWGEQTFDEMFFASYQYIHADSPPETSLSALK